MLKNSEEKKIKKQRQWRLNHKKTTNKYFY
jgi:hypothetical protein